MGGGMGGGYGGHGGHGKFNPLLLTLLGGCKETHTGGCTQPTVANGDANQKCGMNDQGLSCQSAGPNPTTLTASHAALVLILRQQHCRVSCVILIYLNHSIK